MVIGRGSKKVILIGIIVVILFWIFAGYNVIKEKREFDNVTWYQVTGTYEYTRTEGNEGDDTLKYCEYYSYFANDGNKYYYLEKKGSNYESHPDITIYVDEENPSHCTTIAKKEKISGRYVVLAVAITICILMVIISSLKGDYRDKWIKESIKGKRY
ncbi:MAG: DUF3592 domain-containing protein [Roseburia sp.]